MNPATASTAWRQYPSAGLRHLLPPKQRLVRRLLMHPLTAICAVQAVLSLSLVWSNTAFADEAQYLRSGQLEWAHWLHGAYVPPFLQSSLSGSISIYPPLGALANSVGGLIGARILSLLFMLGVTILLYLTAGRLFDRTVAVIAAALWALSEPAIRLAFATFDPLSVLLTAFSAWFIVRAGYHYRRYPYVAAAAIALALANATAFSGIIIDPVVIVFAFLVWLPLMRKRGASLCTMWLTAILTMLFVLLMTASGSWTGLMSTVINRSGSDHQNILLVLADSWGYSGLIAVLATIGAITAFGAETRSRAALLVLLGFTALVVPAAQFHEQTAWSLDKHLAYGILFTVIAAAYGCSTLIRRLPKPGRKFAACCCAIAFIYPAAISWESAWNVYHAWPNAQSFITNVTPIVAKDDGSIYISETGPENIAEYYTPEGQDQGRWSTALVLNPVTIPQNKWESYYATQLRDHKYGVIVLFYATTFSSIPTLPANVLLSPPGRNPGQELLRLEGDSPGEPGLPALTLAIEDDQTQYFLAKTGSYDSSDENGLYAIWQNKAQS